MFACLAVFIFIFLFFFIFIPDLSEKKSNLRVCDKATCRYGGICRDNGADLKCVCQFQVIFFFMHFTFYITCTVIGDLTLFKIKEY